MEVNFQNRDANDPVSGALLSPSERAGWYRHNAAAALIKHWLKFGMEQLIEEVLKRRSEWALL